MNNLINENVINERVKIKNRLPFQLPILLLLCLQKNFIININEL